MHAGVLTPQQIRGWVANRYYYQKCIPVKDAAILTNLPDRFFRRVWIKRIIEHDGGLEEGGGIERWLALARAVGLDEADIVAEREVQPGTREAVDSYVAFARFAPWIVAVASSLTELFAPELMAQRVAALTEKYPWIEPSGLEYFRNRIPRAVDEAGVALDWVCRYADTPELQEACVDALRFKCDVLWKILDAVQNAYGIGAL